MANPNEKPIEELRKDISKARAWALKHFNAAQEESDLLSPPTFFVEFPDVDKMKACPRLYGRPLGIWFEYRLTWIAGTLAWEGRNPLTGAPLPLLRVE